MMHFKKQVSFLLIAKFSQTLINVKNFIVKNCNGKEVYSCNNHTGNSLRFIFYFCFVSHLKGAKYARKYCALMLMVHSFIFIMGISACIEQNASLGDKAALAV